MKTKIICMAICGFLGLKITLSQTNSYEFINYKSGNHIYDISSSSSYVFVGTSNGAVQRNYNGGIKLVHNTENGLLNNSVNKIFVESDNKIWFATPEGLVFYNGVSYTAYNQSNGLLNNDIRALCADSAGNIWVANFGGISLFNQHNWVNYTYADTFTTVFNSIINYGGLTWCTSNANGILSFDKNNWVVYNKSNGFPSNNLVTSCKDTSGILWVASADSGLIEYNGSWIHHYNSILDTKTIKGFFIDKNNTKWILTNNGVIKYSSNNWSLPVKLSSLNLMYGEEDNKGNLWFASDTLLMKYFPSADSIAIFLADNVVLKGGSGLINVDTNNTAWICGYNGITKKNNNSWTSVPYSDINTSFSHLQVTGVNEDSHNNTWLSYFNPSRVSFYNGSSWTTFDSGNSNLNTTNAFLSMGIDTNNYVWVGSDHHGGVQFYDGLQWSHFNGLDIYNPNDVYQITVDKNNNKWFGTSIGIFKYDGNTISKFDASSGLADSYCGNIAVDSKNNIWASTYSTLAKYNGTLWQTYTTDSGLAEKYIRAIAIDKFDNVWCGHQSLGLSRFDPANNTWNTFSTIDGLGNNQVNSIAVNKQNEILIATAFGLSICKVSTVDLNIVADKNNAIYDNGNINIPVSASNFKKIKSVAFSMHFDKTILKFKGIKNGELHNLSISDFDTSNVQNGTLTLNYNKSDIYCQSIKDNTVMFYITAEVINSGIDSTQVLIDNSPVAINIKNYNGKKLEYNIHTFRFKISDLVNIQETNTEKIFSVFPNPASKEVTIAGSVNITSIIISDISGKVIRNVNSGNEKIFHLNVQDLEQGIYLFRLATESGEKSLKLIKIL